MKLFIDDWMQPRDGQSIMPAISRAKADGMTEIRFKAGKQYHAEPNPTYGAIWLWSGVQVIGNGATINVHPTEYATKDRDRYAILNAAAGTEGVTIRELGIAYDESDAWRNITLDGSLLYGEWHTIVDCDLIRPRAGAKRECFGWTIKGPTAYPNPTNRMERCRVLWPQANAGDDFQSKYRPEVTPFFMGGGSITDCHCYIAINSEQVSPCQGASGRGRNLTVRGTRIFVKGDASKAKATWFQLPDGTGLPECVSYDNQVVSIY